MTATANDPASYAHLTASIERRRGTALTAEHRAKLSAAGKRRYADPAERQAMSQIQRGKIPSAETRAKMSAYHKGRPKSESARFNLAMTKLGISGALMASVHEALALVAQQHGISMDVLRRIARSRAVVVAKPAAVEAERVAETQAAVAREKPCLGCGKPFERTKARRFQCEPCAKRSDA